jgi:hypothetical protein
MTKTQLFLKEATLYAMNLPEASSGTENISEKLVPPHHASSIIITLAPPHISHPNK